MTEQQKRLAKLLTVSGVIIAVIVIVALIYNIVTLVNLNTRKAEVEERIEYLSSVVEENRELIEFRGQSDYIERYARDYLNMMGQYEIAFRGE